MAKKTLVKKRDYFHRILKSLQLLLKLVKLNHFGKLRYWAKKILVK